MLSVHLIHRSEPGGGSPVSAVTAIHRSARGGGQEAHPPSEPTSVTSRDHINAFSGQTTQYCMFLCDSPKDINRISKRSGLCCGDTPTSSAAAQRVAKSSHILTVRKITAPKTELGMYAQTPTVCSSFT